MNGDSANAELRVYDNAFRYIANFHLSCASPVVFEKVVSNLQPILYTYEEEAKSKLFIKGLD